jgi:hypothetical protein
MGRFLEKEAGDDCLFVIIKNGMDWTRPCMANVPPIIQKANKLCTTGRTAAGAVLTNTLESNLVSTLGAQGKYVTLPEDNFMNRAMGLVNRRVHSRLRD